MQASRVSGEELSITNRGPLPAERHGGGATLSGRGPAARSTGIHAASEHAQLALHAQACSKQLRAHPAVSSCEGVQR